MESLWASGCYREASMETSLMAKPCPKRRRYVNQAHLDHIHDDCICVGCGRKSPRGHHLRSKGAGAGDHQTLPLCSFPDYEGPTCHDEIHNGKFEGLIGRKAFEKKRGINTLVATFDCWASSPANVLGVWDSLDEDLSSNLQTGGIDDEI